jgi:nickel-dependent lactate racemase
MQLFTVPQLPMEGPKDLVIRFPETWDVNVHNMAGYNRPAIDIQQIQVALENPIGTSPLGELAKNKKEVVIIFDDYTRGMKWHAVAHAVLEALGAAGIKDEQIRFMCGLGTHGVATRTPLVQKLGEDIVSRYRVYNHNAFTLDNVHLGKTKTWGVDIYANPEVMACDLKIALGAVTPHPINGFGGGSKCVLPGIVSYQTIVDHHIKSFKIAFDAMNAAAKTGAPSKVGLGIYDPADRPAIDVDDEAAEMVGLDFLVNVIANGRGEAVGIWAGDFRQVFVEALTDGKENYATEPAVGKDIVVANAFYKANEPMIALLAAGPSLKKTGGTVVLIANMPEGLTTHYFQGDWGATAQGKPPHANAVNIPEVVDQLIVYNAYPHPGASWWVAPKEKIVHVTQWGDVIALLQQKYPGKPSVAIYPNADFQYMRSPDGKPAYHDIHPAH